MDSYHGADWRRARVLKFGVDNRMPENLHCGFALFFFGMSRVPLPFLSCPPEKSSFQKESFLFRIGLITLGPT